MIQRDTSEQMFLHVCYLPYQWMNSLSLHPCICSSRNTSYVKHSIVRREKESPSSCRRLSFAAATMAKLRNGVYDFYETCSRGPMHNTMPH